MKTFDYNIHLSTYDLMEIFGKLAVTKEWELSKESDEFGYKASEYLEKFLDQEVLGIGDSISADVRSIVESEIRSCLKHKLSKEEKSI